MVIIFIYGVYPYLIKRKGLTRAGIGLEDGVAWRKGPTGVGGLEDSVTIMVTIYIYKKGDGDI